MFSYISVNGNWAIWNRWSDCSLPCGGGTQRRHRYCNNPIPLFGGLHCVTSQALRATDEMETHSCNMNYCPGINIILLFLYNMRP